MFIKLAVQFVVIAGFAVMLSSPATAQGRPASQLNCYECAPINVWPYGGLRCMQGGSQGGACVEFINNETREWECHLSGTCGSHPTISDDPDAKVVKLDGALVMATPAGRGEYVVDECSVRHRLIVDVRRGVVMARQEAVTAMDATEF